MTLTNYCYAKVADRTVYNNRKLFTNMVVEDAKQNVFVPFAAMVDNIYTVCSSLGAQKVVWKLPWPYYLFNDCGFYRKREGI